MVQSLVSTWLQLMCQAIPHTRYARVILEHECFEPKTIKACWPNVNEAKNQELDLNIEMVQSAKSPMFVGPMMSHDDSESILRAAHPLTLDGQFIGVVAIELKANDQNQQSDLLKLIQWGNAWLALVLGASAPPQSTQSTHDHIQQILLCDDFQKVAINTIALLNQEYHCARLSLGLFKKGQVELIATSNSSTIPHNSELSVQLEKAMLEALEANQPVFWDKQDEHHQAHHALGYGQCHPTIVTILLKDKYGAFGALTFEGTNLHQKDLSDNLESLGLWLGPLLSLKYQESLNSVSIFKKDALRFRRWLFKPQSRLRYLSMATGAFLVSAFLVWPVTHKIGGEAHVQGKVQRALIAPFEGYVSESYARAGQIIEQGQLVAKLDDKELMLEQQELIGDKDELKKQYRRSLAELNPSEGTIIKAQLAQKEARINLIEQKLSRTDISATFDGVIVAGDLTRSVGKPVKKGEVLFEIAPLNRYRVIIKVNDHEVHPIKVGQKGSLVLSSLTHLSIPIEIINITTIQHEQDNAGMFSIEASIQGDVASLRPGMHGFAKIEVGQASRLWVWTHELIDWLRFKLWKWTP